MQDAFLGLVVCVSRACSLEGRLVLRLRDRDGGKAIKNLKLTAPNTSHAFVFFCLAKVQAVRHRASSAAGHSASSVHGSLSRTEASEAVRLRRDSARMLKMWRVSKRRGAAAETETQGA